MVVGRALRATGCASCRLSLIRSFTSIAGPGIRAPHISTRLPRSGLSTGFRYLSQLPHDGQENVEGKHNGRDAKTEDDRFEEDLEEYFEEGLVAAQEAKDGGDVAAVPWYLQVESPQRKPQPLSERQKIPELPETPPPILEPLLQQISIDLGMDDLKLLDLRKLDPPPALGANLLMIIGTARSEKHLHVSADRLCRWLRSTYKLRPDADGLLGRNELKLKLKRKAKRAKLMGTAADETGDDGVRTGWVCVDVGIVEPSEDAVEAPQRENFVGFGRRVDGIRIVVQMLTEEKREQIDLEHLWGGILKRGGHQEIVGTGEEGEAQLSIPSNPGVSSLAGPTSTSGQRRAMHTFARQFSGMQEPGPPPSSTSSKVSSTTTQETFDLNAIQQSALADINAGDFEKAKNDLMNRSHSVPALKDDRWRNVFLTLMRIYIQSIPEEQSVEELTLPSKGSDPTPFMACFQSAVSFFPTQFGAESEIWLHCFARDLAHPSYTLYDLGGFVNKLQGYGVPISRDSYMTLIRSALSPRNNLEPHLERSSFSADIVLDILRVMQDQGLEILDEDMFVDLLELTEPTKGYSYRKGYSDATHVYDLEVQKPPNIQRRLHLLMMKLPLPLFQEESRIRLLNIYARNHHWWEFFDVFRMAPRACKPNSPAMYAYMFACVANTGHQRGCMSVLRNWLPDMGREVPPVKLDGDVAEAVKACLRVADPHVEQDAAEIPELKGEWVSIWRQCR